MIFSRINITIFMLLVHSNVALYLANDGFPMLAPKYIISVCMMIMLASFVFEGRVFRESDKRLLLVSLLGIVMILFFYFITLLFREYDHGETTIFEKNRIIFYFTIIIVLHSVRTLADLRYTMILVAFLAVISTILNFIDLSTMDKELFSEIVGRAAGLYKNPNITGRVLLYSMLLSLFVIPKSFRMPYFLFIFLGVLTTVSRGSILLYLVTFILLVFYKIINRETLKKGFIFVAVIIGLLAMGYNSEFFNEKVNEMSTKSTAIEKRLNQVNDVSSTVKEDSRLELLRGHFEEYAKSPIIGSGLGFSQQYSYNGEPTGSHNQLVYSLNEYGLIGAVFLLFYACSIGGSTGCSGLKEKPVIQIFFIIFIMYIFFTHSMLSLYPDAILFALAYKISVYYKELDY